MPEWPIPTLGNGLRKGSPLASWSNRGWAMKAFLPYRKSGRHFPGRKTRGGADTVRMDTGRRDHSGCIGTTPGSPGSPKRRERRDRRNAEGVIGLSPGWRLCGTLGNRQKKRLALKERNRSRDLAELSSSSNDNVGFSIDARTDSFALSELIALLSVPRVPQSLHPRAESYHTFGVPISASFPIDSS
jgi:hypothetical protein